MPRAKKAVPVSETSAEASADPGKASSDSGNTLTKSTGQDTYYVWNEKTEFVKSFSEEQYKGEAFKYAQELASQHEGWTIT